ncbi:hypothetical protein R1flu_003528 [Riccia fluitans]|uniref:Uncharacterized protein n=1 Tax=Riccia fluitans TaxID=41844 RepID=A0ABD1Y995_9MARC
MGLLCSIVGARETNLHEGAGASSLHPSRSMAQRDEVSWESVALQVQNLHASSILNKFVLSALASLELALLSCHCSKSTMEDIMSMIKCTVPGLRYLTFRKLAYDLQRYLPRDTFQEFRNLFNDRDPETVRSRTTWETAYTILRDHPFLVTQFKRILPDCMEYNTYIEETLNLKGDSLEAFRILMQDYRDGQLSVEKYGELITSIFSHQPDMAHPYLFSVVVQAMEFAKMANEKFVEANQGHRFKEFASLICDYDDRRGEFADYRFRIAMLFANDLDLLEGFNQFLPEHERIIPLFNHGYMDGVIQAGGAGAVDIGGGVAEGLPVAGGQIPVVSHGQVPLAIHSASYPSSADYFDPMQVFNFDAYFDDEDRDAVKGTDDTDGAA